MHMATQRQAELALDLHEDDLSRRKNVVGLGIVPVDDDKPQGKLAVAVYVKKKCPPTSWRRKISCRKPWKCRAAAARFESRHA